MSSRDRRSTSESAEDRRLTTKLLNAAITYSSREDADADFVDVVARGCVANKRNEYPPKGHGYPRKGR
ncbi:hypothetical protein AB0A70_06485 [Streptomyces morookaense]|uniref:hypothetical protein n=1 Tax=Streptomyces morookaense TaxID=1970 RepID=UPI0033DAE6E2